MNPRRGFCERSESQLRRHRTCLSVWNAPKRTECQTTIDSHTTDAKIFTMELHSTMIQNAMLDVSPLGRTDMCDKPIKRLSADTHIGARTLNSKLSHSVLEAVRFVSNLRINALNIANRSHLSRYSCRSVRSAPVPTKMRARCINYRNRGRASAEPTRCEPRFSLDLRSCTRGR